MPLPVIVHTEVRQLHSATVSTSSLQIAHKFVTTATSAALPSISERKVIRPCSLFALRHPEVLRQGVLLFVWREVMLSPLLNYS